MASSGMAVCAAPADYEELARKYGPEIESMVWKQLGAYAQSADIADGVQYILQQFWKNDVIAQYVPGTVSGYNGREVTFAAFIKAKIALYCRGLREQLQRRGDRELLVVDTPADSGDNRWIDTVTGTSDDYPSMGDSEALEKLREGLSRCVPPSGGPSLVSIFDAMAARHADGRPMTAQAMRREIGASSTEQAGEWLGELRAALKVVASPKRYELGGALLSAAQVREAADVLKRAPGNRVLPAWQEAGHPLAKCGKTWYLKFAAETQARYPQCRVAKGGHYEGGHFGRVKAALIYGLEMLIETGPAPVVRDDDMQAWARLEAAVLRLPGVMPDTAEAILEAARLLAGS